ncbi:hypothetical protein J2X56_005109 [Herbaspirillum sp. 1173]|uniref:hypothetical protein n=1 Tax=Herbaspirillum sp. 1173 TaxID=2817734 RepID=UPI002857AB68|nr:hypothetical protein [Herbaspirillum sp. 1173]MDR6743074.1 hypothetical protein [Herbaspirillum sp. 1173]
MQVIVYQMRRNGVEIARALLGDEASNIGELRVGVFEDGDRSRPTKVARLRRDSGEVIMELVDVQVDAIRHRAWSSRESSDARPSAGWWSVRGLGFACRLERHCCRPRGSDFSVAVVKPSLNAQRETSLAYKQAVGRC